MPQFIKQQSLVSTVLGLPQGLGHQGALFISEVVRASALGPVIVALV